MTRSDPDERPMVNRGTETADGLAGDVFEDLDRAFEIFLEGFRA